LVWFAVLSVHVANDKDRFNPDAKLVGFVFGLCQRNRCTDGHSKCTVWL
jgi:hypothetical protein